MEENSNRGYSIVHNHVKDYSQWKMVFDELDGLRKKSGAKSHQVFRSDSNPNEIYILIAWDNIENAKKYMNSSELKDAMIRAGVQGMPEINIINEVEFRMAVKFPEMK